MHFGRKLKWIAGCMCIVQSLYRYYFPYEYCDHYEIMKGTGWRMTGHSLSLILLSSLSITTNTSPNCEYCSFLNTGIQMRDIKYTRHQVATMCYRLYGKSNTHTHTHTHTHTGKITILAVALAGKGCAELCSHMRFSWIPPPPPNHQHRYHVLYTHTRGTSQSQTAILYYTELDVCVCVCVCVWSCLHESEWVYMCVII